MGMKVKALGSLACFPSNGVLFSSLSRESRSPPIRERERLVGYVLSCCSFGIRCCCRDRLLLYSREAVFLRTELSSSLLTHPRCRKERDLLGHMVLS